MSVYWLKRLYSLDTLDSRFSTSSKTPLIKTAQPHGFDLSSPAVGKSDKSTTESNISVQSRAQPSKWNTSEYYFYAVWVAVAVFAMTYVPYGVSKGNAPNWSKFEPLLSNGWIPGRKVDNSDQQYASFRDNIPAMAIVVLLHPLLRRLVNPLIAPFFKSKNSSIEASGDTRLDIRVTYDLIFATIFLFVLHGFSAFKVFLILVINYNIATQLPRRYIPAVTWVFSMVTLFANELCGGYPYERMAKYIPILAKYGAAMDSYGGLIPRWEILFNITVLRLISFNMDYYWSLQQHGASTIEKKQLDPAALSERDRITIPGPSSSYTFSNYLSYILYSPLYLAGPIITFNDYISQLRYSSFSATTSRTILYGVRFLFTLLTMEIILHYIYAVAISKSNPTWSLYTPFQLSMLGFFNLHIIWLKLLIPWRFFRLWALLDGVDPPENMARCMSNNYSALAFWRGWHRSFNRWIIRYIYIPLGGGPGSRSTPIWRGVANMLLVFTFVALWHDISARLLAWSWLVVVFIVPELVCSALFPAARWKDSPNAYRYLCGVGAVGNIFMMMAANLVGFALGLDGLQMMLNGILAGWQGWVFLVMAGSTLFVGSMVMFEIREGEKRRGVDLKC